MAEIFGFSIVGFAWVIIPALVIWLVKIILLNYGSEKIKKYIR